MLRLFAFAERVFRNLRTTSNDRREACEDMPASSTHDALRHYWIDPVARR